MVINKIGEYRVLESFKTTNSISIDSINAGSILKITQIDKRYHKVIGAGLLDWIYWDLPVEFVGG